MASLATYSASSARLRTPGSRNPSASFAQKCGIPLPRREYNSPEEAAEAGLRRRLLDLHEAAAAFFEEQLRSPEGAIAREYLSGRGVTLEAIKTFRLGYAPDNFNALRERLTPMADQETLRASGLFSWKEAGDGTDNGRGAGRLYDRFRQARHVPHRQRKRPGYRLHRPHSRVDLEARREKPAPSTSTPPRPPLYSKGQVLFNLDKAKAAMRSMEFALLVEGQMDCISVYMRGILNVIATSGTAFHRAPGRVVAPPRLPTSS